MGTKAYSYLRFSTPEQAKGDSSRRQSALAEEYAAKHGLELDTKLTFQDLGVSAFRGTNARTGALGAFLRAVDDGIVPAGSFLLVESLDRVSRQDAWDAFPVLQQIVNAGVTLVTLVDGKTYSRPEMRENPMRILESLFVMIRANEESATKGRRLRAAWEGKRLKAGDKPLTAVCPAWLHLDPTSGRFEVIEERAEVVRRIFQMARDGIGQHSIAQALNDDGTPTFGHHGRRAALWGRSYIAKILESPAVYGMLVPHVVEHAEGVKRRRPLDPVPDYYPAVVREEDFRAVQATRLGDHTARHRSGSTGPVSLLAGLAECPACGSTMTRVSKGAEKRAGKPRLVCVRAKARRCAGRSAILEDVEAAIVARVEEIAATAPIGGEELQAEVERLDIQADALRMLMEQAEEDWRSFRTAAARERLTRLEAEWGLLEVTRKETAERRAASGPGLVRRLEELRAEVAVDPIDRPRVNALLRQIIKAVVVDVASGTLRFRWHVGGESAVSFGWGD